MAGQALSGPCNDHNSNNLGVNYKNKNRRKAFGSLLNPSNNSNLIWWEWEIECKTVETSVSEKKERENNLFILEKTEK